MSYDDDPYEGGRPVSGGNRPRNARPSGGGGSGGGSGGDHTRAAIESGKYTEVKVRIQKFYAAYPTGAIVTDKVKFIRDLDGADWVHVRAKAYRTPDDPHPGEGNSWMRIPGKTPYTNGSEVENCETSAWGRAIAAVGIAIDQNIATVQEIMAKGGVEPPSRTNADALADAAAAAAGSKEPRGDDEEPSAATEPSPEPAGQEDATEAVPEDPEPVAPAPEKPKKPRKATATPEPTPDPAAAEAAAVLEGQTQTEGVAPAGGLSYEEFVALAREKFIPNGHIQTTARGLIEKGGLRQVGGVREMSDQERLTLLMAAMATMEDANAGG